MSPLTRSVVHRSWLPPLLALLAAVPAARAQWTSESYELKAGWNAIWLPLEVSHAAIPLLADGQIEELWRWNASEAGTFTDTPAGPPSQTELQWNVWRRADAAGSTLFSLTGNAAYLVKVAEGVPDFTWVVKGKPLPPRFEWSGSGLNFVGFPAQTPANTAQRSLGHSSGLTTFCGPSSLPTSSNTAAALSVTPACEIRFPSAASPPLPPSAAGPIG